MVQVQAQNINQNLNLDNKVSNSKASIIPDSDSQDKNFTDYISSFSEIDPKSKNAPEVEKISISTEGLNNQTGKFKEEKPLIDFNVLDNNHKFEEEQQVKLKEEKSLMDFDILTNNRVIIEERQESRFNEEELDPKKELELKEELKPREEFEDKEERNCNNSQFNSQIILPKIQEVKEIAFDKKLIINENIIDLEAKNKKDIDFEAKLDLSASLVNKEELNITSDQIDQADRRANNNEGIDKALKSNIDSKIQEGSEEEIYKDNIILNNIQPQTVQTLMPENKMISEISEPNINLNIEAQNKLTKTLLQEAPSIKGLDPKNIQEAAPQLALDSKTVKKDLEQEKLNVSKKNNTSFAEVKDNNSAPSNKVSSGQIKTASERNIALKQVEVEPNKPLQKTILTANNTLPEDLKPIDKSEISSISNQFSHLEKTSIASEKMVNIVPSPEVINLTSQNVIDQIKVSMEGHKEQPNKITFTLTPEVLGRIEIIIDSDKVDSSVKIYFEKQETLEMMQGDIQALEKIVQEVGKLENTNLSLMLKNQDKGGQQSSSHENARVFYNPKKAAEEESFWVSIVGDGRVDIRA